MKQNVFKRLMVYAGMTCLALSMLFVPTTTVKVQAAAGSETIMPMSAAIYWVYKKENGKLYKRLFNYTSNDWIGDWIYVRDL